MSVERYTDRVEVRVPVEGTLLAVVFFDSDSREPTVLWSGCDDAAAVGVYAAKALMNGLEIPEGRYGMVVVQPESEETLVLVYGYCPEDAERVEAHRETANELFSPASRIAEFRERVERLAREYGDVVDAILQAAGETGFTIDTLGIDIWGRTTVTLKGDGNEYYCIYDDNAGLLCTRR